MNLASLYRLKYPLKDKFFSYLFFFLYSSLKIVCSLYIKKNNLRIICYFSKTTEKQREWIESLLHIILLCFSSSTSEIFRRIYMYIYTFFSSIFFFYLFYYRNFIHSYVKSFSKYREVTCSLGKITWDDIHIVAYNREKLYMIIYNLFSSFIFSLIRYSFIFVCILRLRFNVK